jgi:phosphopantetheine--protein transferase-like protein
MNIFPATLRIGNDIVDLTSPDISLKHLNKRFIERVFTRQEQRTILNSVHKEKMLWSIWAAKEAAFKACQKEFPGLVFSHQKFSIQEKTLALLKSVDGFQKKLTGILNYQDLQLALQWQWENSFVHCVSVLSGHKTLFHAWEEIQSQTSKLFPVNFEAMFLKNYFTRKELSSIYSEQSLQTRFYAKQFLLASGFNRGIEIIRPLRIIKGQLTKTPPVLCMGENICIKDEISLSHDGDWVGIIFRRG